MNQSRLPDLTFFIYRQHPPAGGCLNLCDSAPRPDLNVIDSRVLTAPPKARQLPPHSPLATPVTLRPYTKTTSPGREGLHISTAGPHRLVSLALQRPLLHRISDG